MPDSYLLTDHLFWHFIQYVFKVGLLFFFCFQPAFQNEHFEQDKTMNYEFLN